VEISVPDCAMAAYRLLLPNIIYDKVRFFVGIPTLISTGQPAITQDYGGQERHIYFRNAPDFCNLDDFLLGAHELVHVLQIQNLPAGPASWNFAYTVCFLASGTSQHGNCYEDDAYEYANAKAGYWGYSQDSLLRRKFAAAGITTSPCACGPAASNYGLPSPSPSLDQIRTLTTQDPSVVKLYPGACSPSTCLSEAASHGAVGVLRAAFAAIAAAIVWFATLAGVNTGTLAGLVVGGLAGLALGGAIGAGIGAAIGVLATLLGVLIGAVLGLVLGAALGGLIGSLIQDLIDFIVTLFGGDSGGALNLVFGHDDTLDFPGSKVHFQRSREQMGLTVGVKNLSGVLWVGWTGTDNALNVITLEKDVDPIKKTFEHVNHCGPALAFDFASNTLVVCWQGFDGRLNLRTSTDFGNSFDASPKITFGPQGPADATPGIAFLNGFFYLAWIGAGNKLNLWGFSDVGRTAVFQNELQATTYGQGTAALAAAGDGRVFLAYLDSANAQPILDVYGQQPDGNLTFVSRKAVNFGAGAEIADDATGPTVSFDEVLHRVMVSWIGNNNSDIIVGFSSDGVAFNTRTVLIGDPRGPSFEQSRGNTGPAILAAGNRIVWGWTGRG
jgi:hypothetical protein